jgi:hypothetical protein
MGFDPNHYLGDELTSVAEAWSSEHREYWGVNASAPPPHLTDTEWKWAKLVNLLAERVAQAAKSMHVDPAGDLGRTIDSVRQKHGIDFMNDPLLRQSLHVHLASDLREELNGMVDRALQLIAFLSNVPYDTTRAYLERVADCYIRGLETETVVMCGAAIDSALQKYVPDDRVTDIRARYRRRAPITERPFEFSLGQRLDALHRAQVISDTTIDIAFKIVGERNIAAHDLPGLTHDVMNVVRNTASVLNELEAALGNGSATESPPGAS